MTRLRTADHRSPAVLFTRTVGLLAVLGGQPTIVAGDRPLEHEDDGVHMRLVLRTPMQLSAFYQGREFNHAAIDRILETCFVTPIIKNKAFDVLWLELDRWQFSTNGRSIARIKRDYWTEKWGEANLPQAQRSTFGWTLMPEVRDLRLDESVGGSVVIPWQSRPFTLTAHFATDADKRGPTKTIVFEDIECAIDEEQGK